MKHLIPKILGTSLLLVSLIIIGCGSKTTSPDLGVPVSTKDKISQNAFKKTTEETPPVVHANEPKDIEKTKDLATEAPITIEAPSKMPLPPEIPSDMANFNTLDRYFSIISSVYLPDFDQTSPLTGEDVIHFIVSYRYNHYGDTDLFEEIDTYTTSLSTEQVDSDALQFFGVKQLKHKSTPSYDLVDNHYVIQHSDGGEITISKVNSVRLITEDLYEISGLNYVASSGFAGDLDDPVEEWATLEEFLRPEPFSCFTAQMTRDPATRKFILIQYHTEDVLDDPYSSNTDRSSQDVMTPIQWSIVTSGSELDEKTGDFMG